MLFCGKRARPTWAEHPRDWLLESAHWMEWTPHKGRTDLYLCWTRWIHEGLSFHFSRLWKMPLLWKFAWYSWSVSFSKGFYCFSKQQENKDPWKQTETTNQENWIAELTSQSKESGFLSLISSWHLLLYHARGSNSDVCSFVFWDLSVYFFFFLSFPNMFKHETFFSQPLENANWGNYPQLVLMCDVWLVRRLI